MMGLLKWRGIIHGGNHLPCQTEKTVLSPLGEAANMASASVSQARFNPQGHLSICKMGWDSTGEHCLLTPNRPVGSMWLAITKYFLEILSLVLEIEEQPLIDHSGSEIE